MILPPTRNGLKKGRDLCLSHSLLYFHSQEQGMTYGGGEPVHSSARVNKGRQTLGWFPILIFLEEAARVREPPAYCLPSREPSREP